MVMSHISWKPLYCQMDTKGFSEGLISGSLKRETVASILWCVCVCVLCVPRFSLSIQVSTESLYGTNTPPFFFPLCSACSARAWITLPSVVRDLLMFAASWRPGEGVCEQVNDQDPAPMHIRTCSLRPSAPVSFALSLPAKSTRLILLTFSATSPLMLSFLHTGL